MVRALSSGMTSNDITPEARTIRTTLEERLVFFLGADKVKELLSDPQVRGLVNGVCEDVAKEQSNA